MDGFNFLFSFYGLLLGLAVASVTTGFADMWRSHERLPVGRALPLLGLFILLAAAEQWVSFWQSRNSLTMGSWELLTGLAMALPYIFVSQAMTPRDHDARWASLEDYYETHRRTLLAVLSVPPVISFVFNVTFGGLSVVDAIEYGLRFGIPALLIAVNKRWVQHIGLIGLSVLMLVEIFAT
jgi:hypothetical protein